MTRNDFVAKFGGIVEHSPWVAERAYDAGMQDCSSAEAICLALITQLRKAGHEERLAVLCAHPDLAGRLAVAGELTEDSKIEQASAGLDRLSAQDFAEFIKLNEKYQKKFGFPFIIAVKGLTKDEILSAFRKRVENEAAEEFKTACAEVERIVMLRLKGMLR